MFKTNKIKQEIVYNQIVIIVIYTKSIYRYRWTSVIGRSTKFKLYRHY